MPSIPTPNMVISRGDSELGWADAFFWAVWVFCQGLLGFDLFGSVGFVVLFDLSNKFPTVRQQELTDIFSWA